MRDPINVIWFDQHKGVTLTTQITVVHLTSAHPRSDVRIFHKQCKSLSSSKFIVKLVVADGFGDNENEGVEIIDVGKPRSRIKRMFVSVARIFNQALILDGDIYHLHDPELIPIGLKLLNRGKLVIFDSHEDVPKQLLSKPYLNRFSQIVLSKLFEFYEIYSLKKFSGLIGATPSISKKLAGINDVVVNVNNYPLIDELHLVQNNTALRTQIAYVGAISEIRGIKKLLEALNFIKSDTRLSLAGCFVQKALEVFAKNYHSWSKVKYHGIINRHQVAELLSKSFAGIVTFLPYPNHLDAQPNKMFEYMSAGVPVIGSNFSLWKEIIETNNCGICVDPDDPEQIANAIDYLATHPNEVKRMGQNGISAVRNKYNWSIEEKKLFEFYDLILMGRRQE